MTGCAVSIGSNGATTGWAVRGGMRGTGSCTDTACCAGFIGFSSSRGSRLVVLLVKRIARYMPFAYPDVRPVTPLERRMGTRLGRGVAPGQTVASHGALLIARNGLHERCIGEEDMRVRQNVTVGSLCTLQTAMICIGKIE
jgi:hypothetical protein